MILAFYVDLTVRVLKAVVRNTVVEANQRVNGGGESCLKDPVETRLGDVDRNRGSLPVRLANRLGLLRGPLREFLPVSLGNKSWKRINLEACSVRGNQRPFSPVVPKEHWHRPSNNRAVAPALEHVPDDRDLLEVGHENGLRRSRRV